MPQAVVAAPPTSAPTTTVQPEPTTTVAPVVAATAAPATAPDTAPVIERVVVDTAYQPYANVQGAVLYHPSARVEPVAFHEASHDGARQQDPLPTAARPMVLDSRSRGTGDRTAADIVVQPGTEIRSPVTGSVVRGGRYTLYCDHVDEYVVIAPDSHPGWEVKVLHFEGLQVAQGQRVEAGVTVVGVQARQLPFESQVDELTAQPAWPHVHVEVVDPSIPDRPSGGGGC
jgi:biotin carboxyl carrier protein